MDQELEYFTDYWSRRLAEELRHDGIERLPAELIEHVEKILERIGFGPSWVGLALARSCKSPNSYKLLKQSLIESE